MARIIKEFLKNRHYESSNKTNSNKKTSGLERFVEDFVKYSDFTSIN